MVTVICKHFEAAGAQLVPGMVVDSSSWRNEGIMLEQRRIRLATDSEREAFYGGDSRLPRASEVKPKQPTAKAR